MEAPISDRRRRLSRSADFDAAYRQGRSQASRHLVLYAFAREDGESAPRLGVTVGRRVGGAVERNRVKRQLREAFAVARGVRASTDYVAVARPGLPEAIEQHGFGWLVDELSGLLGARAEADA